MSPAAPHSLLDLDARKALARAYVDANRIEEALRLYASVLRQHPQDVETYLAMGDCYLAEGDGETAWLLYQQAARLTPGQPHIQRRLHLACLECPPGTVFLEESQSQSIASLIQRLAGSEKAIAPEEVEQARRLLDEIIHGPHPAQAVAQRLPEVEALLPALLELNIQQALAEGRPDLAHMLQGLLEQMSPPQTPASAQEVDRSPNSLHPIPEPSPCSKRPLRLLFLGPMGEEHGSRQYSARRALASQNCETVVAEGLPQDDLRGYDLVIAHRPHADLACMEALAACAAARLPLLLNLDADYEKMPLDHPDYEGLGLGSATRARAYTSSLMLADLICVPSRVLANSLSVLGHRVRLIPDFWPLETKRGSRPSRLRPTLNLGWIGQAGQVEDVARVRRIILRVMREFPQVNLVIAGDPRVYQLFDSLPESRRLYLPLVADEDLPYLLGQIDILLVPLRTTPFNDTLSERRLLEAGMMGIPWIASPIPAYVEWHAGGLIASDANEWHTCLRQLVLDANLRSALGQAGWEQAHTRTPEVMGKLWLSAIEETLQAAGRSLGV